MSEDDFVLHVIAGTITWSSTAREMAFVKRARQLESDLAAARSAALEEAAKVAEKERDRWRAESDTYTETRDAKFVRNIRAGEANRIAAAIRELKAR